MVLQHQQKHDITTRTEIRDNRRCGRYQAACRCPRDTCKESNVPKGCDNQDRGSCPRRHQTRRARSHPHLAMAEFERLPMQVWKFPKGMSLRDLREHMENMQAQPLFSLPGSLADVAAARAWGALHPKRPSILKKADPTLLLMQQVRRSFRRSWEVLGGYMCRYRAAWCEVDAVTARLLWHIHACVLPVIWLEIPWAALRLVVKFAGDCANGKAAIYPLSTSAWAYQRLRLDKELCRRATWRTRLWLHLWLSTRRWSAPGGCTASHCGRTSRAACRALLCAPLTLCLSCTSRMHHASTSSYELDALTMCGALHKGREGCAGCHVWRNGCLSKKVLGAVKRNWLQG